jgi:peptide deformylase
MAIRRIRIDSDPVLRKKAKKVQAVDVLVLQLLDDMLETMYLAKGVGLAAPQVGISKRIIVCDAGEGPVKLINPRIMRSEGNELMFEGCLSLPNLCGEVERAAKVLVKGLNPKGEVCKLEAEGMMARVLQHEIDHLDGKLFIDIALRMIDKEELEKLNEDKPDDG